jgi:hypothetical protein
MYKTAKTALMVSIKLRIPLSNYYSELIAFHRGFSLSMEGMPSQPSHGGRVEQDSKVPTDLLNVVGLKGNGHLAFESPVERLMGAYPSVRYPS